MPFVLLLSALEVLLLGALPLASTPLIPSQSLSSMITASCVIVGIIPRQFHLEENQTTIARLPRPLPCLCSATPLPPPAHPSPFTLATEHAPLPVTTALLCPDMLLLSRLACPSRAGGDPLNACEDGGRFGSSAPKPLATTHGPAVEAFLERAEYDAETEDAAEASEAAAAAAARVRLPRPSNWGDMSRKQRQNWKHIENMGVA